MRLRPTKFNDTPTIEDAWLDEVERFAWNYPDFEIADCAELADELELFTLQYLEDEEFDEKMDDWNGYVMDNQLWLALEQCCYQGVLLPIEQLRLRVATSPREMQGNLGYLLSHCPAHVLHHLALRYWVVIRVDRARRTANPDWRPDKPPPRDPFHDTVFFRPPVLKFRNYAR